jgi:hypothetical protein
MSMAFLRQPRLKGCGGSEGRTGIKTGISFDKKYSRPPFRLRQTIPEQDHSINLRKLCRSTRQKQGLTIMGGVTAILEKRQKVAEVGIPGAGGRFICPSKAEGEVGTT